MTEPIDVVYTWVDDTFPGYRDLLDGYAGTSHDLNPNRTRDNLDLLKYSLRALHLYAPWVRHIYLVTCRPQVPAWLDRRGERLTLVHHDEFIAAEHLPTFNSFAIVSYLDRIDGLSERFLYFEDDMLLGNRLALADLSDSDGRIRIFPRLEWTRPPGRRMSEKVSPWNGALANSNALLDDAFVAARRRTVTHVPLLIDKPIWREMIARWPEEFDRTRRSRFRTKDNIVPEYLYFYYASYTGQARMMGIVDTYAKSLYHGLENSRLYALFGVFSPAKKSFRYCRTPALSPTWGLGVITLVVCRPMPFNAG